MSFIDLLVPGLSKLFLKFPKEILVNKGSFFCQTAGWSLTTSTNRDSVTHFLSTLQSLSSERQFLDSSHLLSEVHQFIGRFSKPPSCSAHLVPESEGGRLRGQWQISTFRMGSSSLGEIVAPFMACLTAASQFKEHLFFWAHT